MTELTDREKIQAKVLLEKLATIIVHDASKQSMSPAVLSVVAQSLVNVMILRGVDPRYKVDSLLDFAYDMHKNLKVQTGPAQEMVKDPEDKVSEFIQTAMLSACQAEKLPMQTAAYAMTVAMAVVHEAFGLTKADVGMISTNAGLVLDSINKSRAHRKSLN
jgi:hypothetical protein